MITGEIVQSYNGHHDVVRDVSWNPNYPQLVTSSVLISFMNEIFVLLIIKKNSGMEQYGCGMFNIFINSLVKLFI